MGILTFLLGGSEPPPDSIEEAPTGTILIHREQGTIARPYGAETNDYYHEESAADELSARDCISVEIKDATDRIYRYTRASHELTNWL